MKDEQLREVISALLDHETRPAGAEALDVLLVIRLLILRADEKPIKASDVTLSMALAVSETTARACVERARGLNWIHKVSGKSRRTGNLYSVVVDSLPVSDKLKRTVVTDVARQIAGEYVATARFNANGKKRRYTEADRQRIAFTLQQWLAKHCDGDVDLLRGALRYAMAHPLYRANACFRLHRLRRDFSKIVKEFKASGATAPEPQAVGVAAPAKSAARPEPVDANLHPWDAPPLPSKTGQTVYKLQGFTAVGQDELHKLLSDAKALKESEDCKFFMRTATDSKEQRVRVVNFGGHWAVLDVKTGRGIEVEKAA
jgi:hypothetical protein